MQCTFCKVANSDIVWQNSHYQVIYDKYPVTQGHLLILSRRHTATYFDLESAEQLNLAEVLVALKNLLLSQDGKIEGFNIGMNCGEVSGQTIAHFHCHLIPRRRGDSPDPRGGVRGVIPEKQKYDLGKPLPHS